MIRQALILAAGTGSRIRNGHADRPKPLHEVGGVPLLKRTILTLAEGGVERVVVVVGFMADAVRASLDGDLDYRRLGVRVDLVDNPEYERSNGVSVLAARPQLTGPFLLTMADHVFEPELPRLATAADMSRTDLWLCVDRRVADVYDIDDATKVRTSGDRIADIGKTIATYDCIDTGVFAVGPALFESLAEVRAQRGDCSLSDGVRRLAERGRAGVIDIGSAFWQDVDTLGARQRAESELVRLSAERAAARAPVAIQAVRP
jgi:choline kinase